jgi:hypothetical protein
MIDVNGKPISIPISALNDKKIKKKTRFFYINQLRKCNLIDNQHLDDFGHTFCDVGQVVYCNFVKKGFLDLGPSI